MSSVPRSSRHEAKPKPVPEKKMKAIMNEQRWRYCHVGLSKENLKKFFPFLNAAIVLRSGAEGLPLMTTTAAYGPIFPDQTVELVQGVGEVVKVLSDKPKKKGLLDELKKLREKAKAPKKGCSVEVQGLWISGAEGGALPGLDPAANVFGATGSFLVNTDEVVFPVLNIHHPHFHETLAYYGSRLLEPGESFYMGFDKPLFGMEYDTSLPGYIQDYVMQDYGGGGLFVEHHPFPHIWFPNPGEGERKSNICRILLGRVIESKEEKDKNKKANKKENACPPRMGDPLRPMYHFTVFEIPTDGHALAVDECCIHNDSFCNGKQVVFVADTDANTVALRETGPFRNVRITEEEVPYK